MRNTLLTLGNEIDNVVVETYLDQKVTRPRVRCVSHFPPEFNVEFPRKMREDFPIGTKFEALIRVCQKHFEDGTPNGPLYLRASNVSVIVSSIKDSGLRAQLRAGALSGRAYNYIWE